MAALQPWQAARLDTPGAEKVAHLNNAGEPGLLGFDAHTNR